MLPTRHRPAVRWCRSKLDVVGVGGPYRHGGKRYRDGAYATPGLPSALRSPRCKTDGGWFPKSHWFATHAAVVLPTMFANDLVEVFAELLQGGAVRDGLLNGSAQVRQ